MFPQDFSTLFAMSGRSSGHQVSSKDAASNKGNKKEVDKTTQQGKLRTEPGMSNLSEANKIINELIDTNNKQQSEIDGLKNEIKKSQERSDKVDKRSSSITKGMAKVMETKGNFESVNDGLAKIDIAEKFSNVYDREWVSLSRWLLKEFKETPELESIQRLTSLMKKCYMECIRLADKQMCNFMFLDDSKTVPPPENHTELYAIRKQYAQTDTARSKAKQAVLNKVPIDDEMSCFLTSEKGVKTRKLTYEFLNKYVDCCWLMVVSNPPLALNFDIVGKQCCKEHFKVYSAKRRLVDGNNEANIVLEVVWPCVYNADRSVFYKKGDALLGTKDLNTTDDCAITECTCFTKGNEIQFKDATAADKGGSPCNGTKTALETDID